MKKQTHINLVSDNNTSEQTTLDLFTDNINLRVEKIAADAVLPTQSEEQPYAVNLFTHLGLLEEVEVLPGEEYLVDTAVAFALEEDIQSSVYIKPIKSDAIGLSLDNNSGRIHIKNVKEKDYRDLMVKVHNHSNNPITLKKNEPLAQLTFHKGVKNINIEEVDYLLADKYNYFGTE